MDVGSVFEENWMLERGRACMVEIGHKSRMVTMVQRHI